MVTHFIRGCPANLVNPSLNTESAFFRIFFARLELPLEMVMKNLVVVTKTVQSVIKQRHHLSEPMLARPPRAPFLRKSDGKMLKREGVTVVVVETVVEVVEMRRERTVVGGSAGELWGVFLNEGFLIHPPCIISSALGGDEGIGPT